MNPPLLVSVIIPACNAAKHLRETIDSASAQTCTSLEIIVVDDGSTDDTAEIAWAAQRQDPRIRVVRQDNAGVGAARNRGIELARGEFIAPLDADDLWAPTKLERQLERIERAGPDAGLVYCWSRNIDEEDRVLSWGHPYAIEGQVGPAMMLGNFVGNASVPLFRASALRSVGLYLTRTDQGGAQGCEDWDLNIRVGEAFEVCVVPEYLVSYRQSPTGMSVDARGMSRSYETTIGRVYVRRPAVPRAFAAWSASRFYTYLVSKCYTWSDYAGVLYCFGKVLQADWLSLLNWRNHRFALFSFVHLLTRGRLRRHRTPHAITAGADPAFQLPPPAVPPSSGFYSLVQGWRLDTALRTGPRSRAGRRLQASNALIC